MSRSSASGRAGSTSTVTRPLTMPRASPNATSSGARASISTRRKSTSAWRCGALRSERSLGVDVETIEQAAVNGDAGRAPPGPTRVGVSARWPAPSFTPRTITCVRSMSPRQLGTIGPSAHVQLRAREAATGTSAVADARQTGERQLVEHEVDIQVLVGEGDLAV